VRFKVTRAKEEEGRLLRPDMGVIVNFQKPGSDRGPRPPGGRPMPDEHIVRVERMHKFSAAQRADRRARRPESGGPRGGVPGPDGTQRARQTDAVNLIDGRRQAQRGGLHHSRAAARISRVQRGPAAAWRTGHGRFVFQFYNLLPVLTATRTSSWPLPAAAPLGAGAEGGRCMTALTRGLSERLSHRHGQLSGGQQQRVASHGPSSPPDVIVSDEPTALTRSRPRKSSTCWAS